MTASAGVPSRSATSAAGPRRAPSQCPPGTQPCRGRAAQRDVADRPDARAAHRATRVVLVDPQRPVGLAGERAGRASRWSGARRPRRARRRRRPACRPRGATPLVPTSTTCSPRQQAHARGGVPGRGRARRRSGRAPRRAGRRSPRRTTTSTPGGRGDAGDLGADPARADHDEPRARHERVAEPLRVGGGVQGEGGLPARWPDGVRAAWPRRAASALHEPVVGRAPRGRAGERRGRAPGCPGGPRRPARAGRRRSRRRSHVGRGRSSRCFDSGGRSYGATPSAPSTTTRPSKPRSRSAATVWVAARPAADDEHVTAGGRRSGRRRGSGRSPRNGSLPSGGTSEMVQERMSGAAGVRRAAAAHPRRRRRSPRRRRRRARARPARAARPRPARSRSRRRPLDPRAIARASLDAGRNASLWWTSAGIVVATVVAARRRHPGGRVRARRRRRSRARSCARCCPSPGPVALSVRAKAIDVAVLVLLALGLGASSPQILPARLTRDARDARDRERSRASGRASCRRGRQRSVTTRTSSVVTYASSSSSRLSSAGSAANAR